MAKTLIELARELKDYIADLQSDAHGKANFRKERYNNLKLEMDITKRKTPYVLISLAMSDAEYDLSSGQKLTGSLGPDERYVERWLDKSETLPSLKEAWKNLNQKKGEN